MQITNIGLILIVLLVVVIVWAWASCSLKCTYEEGFTSKRGASKYILADNVYGRQQLPDYSEKVKFDIGENHPYYKYVSKCSKGSPSHGKYISDVASKIDTSHAKRCTSHHDCPKGDICVLGGAYSGSPHKGSCMDPLEPFQFSCYPGYYFENTTDRCEPRWQEHKHLEPPRGPIVSIPGSTSCQYGVGITDPYDKKTDVTIY